MQQKNTGKSWFGVSSSLVCREFHICGLAQKRNIPEVFQCEHNTTDRSPEGN